MTNLSLSTDLPARPERTGRYIGPPPIVPALAHVVLFVSSIVVGAAAGVFGRPDTAAAVLASNLSEHAGTARIVACLQVASAVTLGVFTASAVAAVRSRTPRVAGHDIARFGGYGAALLLAVSGLATWSATEAATVDASAVKALTLLSFATGGPGFVALFGLLVAGLAVPLFIGRLAPRWIGGTGIALAVVAELALLSLATDALQPLLPVARFPGAVWLLVVAAIALPRRARR